MNQIWIQPDAGLGNRMNCLYSGLYYSRKYNEKLNILWLREKCCNVDFEDLFEVPEGARIRTIYQLGYKNKYAIKSIASKIYLEYLKKRMDYLGAGQTRYLYIEAGEDGITGKLEQSRQSLLMSSGPFCDKEHFAVAREMLVPKIEILNRVDEIMEPYKGKKVIGIHIRRTDHEIAIENSPLEDFTEYMDQLKDDTYFYLATDDEGIRKEFEKRYRLIPRISYSSNVTRDSSEGMKDALVEMLCLSRCDRIFGSYGSTFSMIAAFVGKKQLDFAGRQSNWNDELKLNECLIKSWIKEGNGDNI